MNESLAGKLAVVTGAGSGVGRAVALALLGEGCIVVAVGRTASKLEQTKALAPVGALIHLFAGDVGIPADVDKLMGEVVAPLGNVEILVNNAGINVRERSLEKLSLADWDDVVRVNLTGVFLMTRAILPGMRRLKNGLVINVSSIAGNRASPLGGASYTASKFGLNGFSGVVSLEEAKHGIRSTVICPGEINTPILDQRPEPVSAERRAADLQPEDVAAAVMFVANLPPRAHVVEMTIKPTVHPYA